MDVSAVEMVVADVDISVIESVSAKTVEMKRGKKSAKKKMGTGCAGAEMRNSASTKADDADTPAQPVSGLVRPVAHRRSMGLVAGAVRVSEADTQTESDSDDDDNEKEEKKCGNKDVIPTGLEMKMHGVSAPSFFNTSEHKPSASSTGSASSTAGDGGGHRDVDTWEDGASGIASKFGLSF